MCGTVGMFVGCAALSYCPKRLLLGETPEAGDEVLSSAAPRGPEYRSAFRNWDERAAVRIAPRRRLTEEEGQTSYFSAELVPIARHSLITALPSATFQEILIQHLYRYLDFTAKLEYLVVNRTVLGIALGSVGVDMPEEMRFDAYRIYCDEAYHGLFSIDLARQVAERTQVVPRLPSEPFFLIRLRHILSNLPPEDRGLAELLFVIISETLISGILADIPSASQVAAAVRDAIRDHAMDEGRHHSYFAQFLGFLWHQLSPVQRCRAGALVPQLIDAFLRPDLNAIRQELRAYGVDPDDIENVIHDVYRPEVVRAHRIACSYQAIRYFSALGAFDDPEALDQMYAYGLAE